MGLYGLAPVEAFLKALEKSAFYLVRIVSAALVAGMLRFSAGAVLRAVAGSEQHSLRLYHILLFLLTLEVV